jgi:hypothetical protein
MRTYLLLAVGLALANCTTTKPPKPAPRAESASDATPPAAGLVNATQTPTTLPVMGVKKGLIAQLLSHSKPETQLSGGVATPTNATQMPRKCKGCQITIQNGNGNTASTKQGDTKAKGGAVVSQDSSSASGLTGSGNLATTKGNNNATTQTKQDTTEEASDWKAELAKPTGAVIAGVVTIVLIGGCLYLIAAYKRRKALQA